MKKYVKPYICFEKFELSSHIAACALDMPRQADVNNCFAVGDPEYGYEGQNFFMNAENGCSDGPIEGYCYTNGTEALNLFNS